VATRAAAVQADVEAALSAVKTRTDELEALKTRLAATLEDDLETSGKHIEDLSTEIDTLDDLLEARLQAASDLVVAFQDAVAEARQEFEEAKGRVLAALEQVENAARDQTQAFVEGVDASLGEAARALVEMANRMLNAHNAAVVDLRRRFVEEFRELADAAVAPLQEAIEELTRAAEQDASALDDAAQAVAPKVDQAMQRLQRAMGVLEQARVLQD
jgi:chromosome segregation ATPase